MENSYRPLYVSDETFAEELHGKLKITQDKTIYTLNDELISILQNSAHEAAAMLKGQ